MARHDDPSRYSPGRYRLRLFGTIELDDPAGASCAELLSQPKRAALLAYLAAAQPFGFQRRDRLLALFWPESDLQSARRSLNQSVHFLRRALGTECVSSRGADEVGLDTTAIDCDTVAFLAAVAREEWTDVLALYRGDLLDGFFVSGLPEFERWLEEARVAYRNEAVRAAWASSREAYAGTRIGDAKRWARWAAEKDPYDESSFRRYLELLDATGDRATAVQAYSEFASRLRDELGIAPSEETTALADGIRDGTARIELRPVPESLGAASAESREPTAASSQVEDVTDLTEHLSAPPMRPVARTVSGTGVFLGAELWSRIAMIGAGTAGVLLAAHAAVIRLGLPDWLFAGAAMLAVVGFVTLVATALMERRRATTVMMATPETGWLHAWLTWRRAIQAGMVAWLAFTVGAGGYLTIGAIGIGPAATLFSAGVLESRDEILVADFESHSGDSLLGHAMTEALRIDLSQSPSVRLVDSDRVAATLELMSTGTPHTFDHAVARDVAERLGVKAIVDGDIVPVGRGHLLTVSLVATDDGAILWAGRIEAKSEDGLIEAAGELSRRLREKIGESLRSVRASPRLERVTTTSTEALKSFSIGMRTSAFADQREATAFFVRATDLDSTFAMAHHQIARSLANVGGSRARQREAITTAFQLRHRTTDLERLLIEATYYALTGDGEGALSAWRQLHRLQPDNWRWWNNIGTRIGANLVRHAPDHDESIAMLDQAFTLCECAFPLGNLTRALLVAGRVDSAQAVIDAQSGRFPEMEGWQLLRGARAYAVGDLATAARELAAGRGRLQHLSGVLAVQGRLAESRAVFTRWAGNGGTDRPPNAYLAGVANHEIREVILGRPVGAALARVDEALRMFPLDSIAPLDRPYLPVAEFFVRAGQPDRAAELLRAFEDSVEPPWRRLNEWRRQLVLGLIEQERFGSERAIPTLERAVREANAFLAPVPDLGFALDRAGEADSAIAVFQRFIGESPRYAAWRYDGKWRAAVLKRLGELYEERGDRREALSYYQQFVELWDGADAELQPQLAEVRRRMAGLSGEPQRALPPRG